MAGCMALTLRALRRVGVDARFAPKGSRREFFYRRYRQNTHVMRMGLATLLLWGMLILANPVQSQPFAYVANATSNSVSVSVIDATTNTVFRTVAVGDAPEDVAVHPEGTFVYVTNRGSNTVSILDAETNSITATVGVQAQPVDIVISKTKEKNLPPVAVASTSISENDRLQLDGILSSDPEGDQLRFEWLVDGESSSRLGQIVSIDDLEVGNYKATLTVEDDSGNRAFDTMLFGVSESSNVAQAPIDILQIAIQNLKDIIATFFSVPEGSKVAQPLSSTDLLYLALNDLKDIVATLPTTSFDGPNDDAMENRRKVILNMLSEVLDSIGIEDFQASIDQLGDLLAKTDGLEPPDSAPDWIVGKDADTVTRVVSDLISCLILMPTTKVADWQFSKN